MKRTRKVYCEKERFEYLKQLLHEFQVTKNNDAKRQVLANLANFCYDPINYDHMRKLNLISILLDLLSESNADIVEYAIAGLCNLSPDAKNVQIIVEYNGIDKIVNCIDEQKPQITISAITTLIHVINNIEPSFQMSLCNNNELIKKIVPFKHHKDTRIKNLVTIFREKIKESSNKFENSN